MHFFGQEPVRHRELSGLAPAVGGLVLMGLASAALAAPEGAAQPGGPGAWSAFVDWIGASYARAPALVLGVAALLAVPPLALVGILMRRRDESGEISELRTRIQRPLRAKAAAPREGVRTGRIPLRPVAAWIEVLDGDQASGQRYSLSRVLLRIGRETDNDVCIADTTVHRYHAAVRRTEDAEFVITDLSSAGGNGVLVNGRSVAEARLSNGDVIELGNARLLFSAPG